MARKKMETRLKLFATISSFCWLLFTTTAWAQPENTAIADGNKLYKKGKFDKAIEAYQLALTQNPRNAVARYNLAAALFRNSKLEDAEKEYEGIGQQTSDNGLKQKATYNNGVSLTKQNKLEESIAAYKKALHMNPSDEEARFNLQKALEELRKKNKQPDKKNQQQKKDKKPEPQKQPPANKKMIEQWLQSLRQKEQEVQKKMQQNKSRSVTQPEKDW